MENNMIKSVEIDIRKKSHCDKGKLINKFIEKFPKVKLHTIIHLTKQYNKIEINENMINKPIYLYLDYNLDYNVI